MGYFSSYIPTVRTLFEDFDAELSKYLVDANIDEVWLLALILKNRTLRFAPLDHPFDPEECNFVLNGVNLGMLRGPRYVEFT